MNSFYNSVETNGIFYLFHVSGKARRFLEDHEIQKRYGRYEFSITPLTKQLLDEYLAI